MAVISLRQQNTKHLKYKKRVKKLKKLILNLVFENASLCDQVAQVQEKILTVKEERRFLFKKLMEQDVELVIEELNNQPLTTFTNDSGVPMQSTRKPYKKRAKKQQESNEATKIKQIVQTISVDSDGVPIYPINMNAFSIHNLGQIVYDRPHYHTEHWIYPAGFVSMRNFAHIKERDRKCAYTCRIVDNGDCPRFEIVPEADLEFIIAGPTPDLCHVALIQTINKNTGQNMELRPQGEWFFGLEHPTIMALLQASPDVSKCINFKSFNIGSFALDKVHKDEPSVKYEALEKDNAVSNYHAVLEVKEEPPDELFEQTH